MTLVLLIAAFICFALSAINAGGGKVNLQSGGLACWVLSVLLGALRL